MATLVIDPVTGKLVREDSLTSNKNKEDINKNLYTGTDETVYMAFKSGRERNAFIKNIEGDPDVVKGTINQYSNPREMTKGGGKVPDTVVAETLQLLTNAKVAEEIQQEFLLSVLRKYIHLSSYKKMLKVLRISVLMLTM